ncbi:hypothetical protein Tco_1575239 [Tanacetum coccineum]
MTKSKICYDHSSKQAIGFEKPFCLKKARESKPKLYDGNTILKMDTIVVPDSDETLELSEKSRSKMLLKEQDPLFFEIYSSHLHFRQERTTATAITEGTWGFEHTKACFRDEIIPFIKELKDIFNNFNQYLVEELADVQKVFYQMEQAVEQHRLESSNFSKCLELKTELLNKKDFVDKETYDKLCKKNSVLNQNAPSFTQLFELSELKAQSQAKDTVIVKLKEQIKSLKGNVEDSSAKWTWIKRDT